MLQQAESVFLIMEGQRGEKRPRAKSAKIRTDQAAYCQVLSYAYAQKEMG